VAKEDAVRQAEVSQPQAKSTLARLGLALGLAVVVLIGVVVYFQHAATNRLRLALDELDRTDPGWRLSDVEGARREIPISENSALRIKAITAALPRSWPPQDLDELLRGAPPELLSAADYARLQKELAPLAGIIAEARKLADFPNGRFPLTYARNPLETLLPDQQEARRVASLLTYDVRQLAQAQDMKQAIASCRAGINVARSLGDEPLLISQLVHIACAMIACSSAERALAQGEPDPADLEKLQQALEQEELDNGLLAALRGERAALHQVFVLIEDGEVEPAKFFQGIGAGESVLENAVVDRVLPFKTRYNARAEHPDFLALLNERIETAKKPLHEQVADDRAFAAKVRDRAVNGRLTRALLPAVEKVSEAFRRQYASLRCLTALVAAERFRRARGRWPATLEELRPDFLAEIPLDPYDGKPLRYKRLADGVLVYTVGPDGTDDGGVLDRANSIRPGTDLGLQLWDVPHRRQPPRPKPAP
jgi:hypothetical protein